MKTMIEIIDDLLRDGLSQQEIAEHAGTTQATICRAVNGTHDVRSSTYLRLYDFYERRLTAQASYPTAQAKS